MNSKTDPFPILARAISQLRFKLFPLFITAVFAGTPIVRGLEPPAGTLRIPRPGDYSLHVLTPTLLELVRITTKPPGNAPVDGWNWVDASGNFVPPDASSVRVVVSGSQTNPVINVGFKRRPIYAPLTSWDLRVANQLYLEVANPIAENQSVQVLNDGSLWPQEMDFQASTSPLRETAAIHVNQEGYLPAFSKQAQVGYYLGSLGEMTIPTNRFYLVDPANGSVVFEGALTRRPDIGFTYDPPPYQQVWEADFSEFTTPGEYRVVVPGMGASLPFRIDEGTGMLLARTYALGLFHQRSGFDVAMPFTRFTHAADHTAPAMIPATLSPATQFTWDTISSYATFTNLDNPPQTAPRLTDPSKQLFPYINPGPVDVSGGHFEAANYSKPAWNAAQTVHVLMFAVDALPGVAALDNLGLPESGDGISDILQEAKWEADFLVKMQDSDGGFYYMIHPQQREYEYDVLPEDGDPQIVWPKNTATTAAVVAALAQCASSPRFRAAYPEAASNYWATAMRGWDFITNALATFGEDGAYQRIMHFDDAFTHRDDIAWAACELYLATGDSHYHDLLKHWFPDPADPATYRWAWWKMFACYGNVIRDYTSAVRSGRLAAGQIDTAYFDKCLTTLTNCAEDNLGWSRQNAYGTSFPEISKHVRDVGWYYSTEQAFDLLTAYVLTTNAAYLDAVIRNINYELGSNPVNVSYLTGLGWKRQLEVVDQYSANDRHSLPKIGVPIGNIQDGFVWTWLYGGELSKLASPPDGAEVNPYPFYDRWCDFWNVKTEASTANTTRSYALAAWLAGQTSLASQPWKWTEASIQVPATAPPGVPLTARLQLPDTNLAGARITWEADEQEPVFGDLDYAFTPKLEAPYWIEAEVQWPDGRRAFATSTVAVTATAASIPPELKTPRILPDGTLAFQLSGVPLGRYRIESSGDLITWVTLGTNTLPDSGEMQVEDNTASAQPVRYYRAAEAP